MSVKYWPGDDMRPFRQWWRRIRSPRSFGTFTSPAKLSLIVLTVSIYVLQTISSVTRVRQRYPSHWPSHALPIVIDSFAGSSLRGRFTMKFAATALGASRQPHRYLTAGFLHGGIFHLATDIFALIKQPDWLEVGLGWPLYLTTFLVSIVTGNLTHLRHPASSSSIDYLMGASGGIFGLYGLMFSCLVKMRNQSTTWMVSRKLLPLVIAGVLVEPMSNMANFGGFLGGMIVGILCGPSYERSYAMRRKDSLAYDNAPYGYRAAMGFGISPSRGLIPLPLFWITIILAAFLSHHKYISIPATFFYSLKDPGILS